MNKRFQRYRSIVSLNSRLSIKYLVKQSTELTWKWEDMFKIFASQVKKTKKMLIYYF